jgi:hypothetical protein
MEPEGSLPCSQVLPISEALCNISLISCLFTLKKCWSLAHSRSWSTTPDRFSTTVYSKYWQLPSICGVCLLRPQPEDAPCRGDRDPHDTDYLEYVLALIGASPDMLQVQIQYCKDSEHCRFCCTAYIYKLFILVN